MQQLVPYIALGVAATLLLVLIFGLLVPRWLRRQDLWAAEQATRLREMLLDVLSEQEAVTLRQAQIGASLSSMQEQIGGLARMKSARFEFAPERIADVVGIARLEQGFEALREQLATFFQHGADEQHALQRVQNIQKVADTQSWTNLLGLLATMQDNIALLNRTVARPQANVAADRLLYELDTEMQNLRALADEVAGIQWKLRRSVLERETSLAALRAQVLNTPKRGHRAA